MIKFLVVLGLSFFNPPQDSIGTETINGKVFILHKVTAGETLYGISKRYNVTVDQILEFNKTADGGLEIDQILKVPYVPRVVRKAAEGKVHIVAEKETLFSISRLYGVTVDELKQWNKLTDSNLSLGQELIVRPKATQTTATVPTEMKSQRTVHTVATGETLFSISRQYGITVEQLRNWNKLDGSELKIGQSLFVVAPVNNTRDNQVKQVTVTPDRNPVTQVNPTNNPSNQNTQNTQTTPVTTAPVETPPATQNIQISESVRGGNEIVQTGLAELIEGTEGNRKYLALHRTAPVGSILKIKNQMNNREVFVRVVGKLPDTALTDKLVIKISRSAYDRLGAIDQRFLVEVTYYKVESSDNQ
jgi:LysM repeat protein